MSEDGWVSERARSSCVEGLESGRGLETVDVKWGRVSDGAEMEGTTLALGQPLVIGVRPARMDVWVQLPAYVEALAWFGVVTDAESVQSIVLAEAAGVGARARAERGQSFWAGWRALGGLGPYDCQGRVSERRPKDGGKAFVDGCRSCGLGKGTRSGGLGDLREVDPRVGRERSTVDLFLDGIQG